MKKKSKKIKTSQTNRSNDNSTIQSKKNLKPKNKKEKKSSPPTKKIFLNELEENSFYGTESKPEQKKLETVMTYKYHPLPKNSDKKTIIKPTNNKHIKNTSKPPIMKIEVNKTDEKHPSKYKKIENRRNKKIITSLKKKDNLNNSIIKNNLNKLIISGNTVTDFHKRPLIPLIPYYNNTDIKKNNNEIHHISSILPKNILKYEKVYSKPVIKNTSLSSKNLRNCSNENNNNSHMNRSFKYLVHQASKNKNLSSSFNKYYENSVLKNNKNSSQKNSIGKVYNSKVDYDNDLKRKNLYNNVNNSTFTNSSYYNDNVVFTKEERKILKKLRENSKENKRQIIPGNNKSYALNTFNILDNLNKSMQENMPLYSIYTHNTQNNTFYSGLNRFNNTNILNNSNNSLQNSYNNFNQKRNSINSNFNSASKNENSQNNNYFYDQNNSKELITPTVSSKDISNNNNYQKINFNSTDKDFYKNIINFDIKLKSPSKDDETTLDINLENLNILAIAYKKIMEKINNDENCLQESYEFIKVFFIKKFYDEIKKMFYQKQNMKTVVYYIKTEILCHFMLYDICISKKFEQSSIILKSIFNDLHKNFIFLLSLMVKKFEKFKEYSGGEIIYNLQNIVTKFYNNEPKEVSESKLLRMMYDSLTNIYVCYRMLIENIYQKYYVETSLNDNLKFPFCITNANVIKRNNSQQKKIIKSIFFVDAYEMVNFYGFNDLKNFFYLYLYVNTKKNVPVINLNINNNIINTESYNFPSTTTNFYNKSRRAGGTVRMCSNSKSNDSMEKSEKSSKNNSPKKYLPTYKYKVRKRMDNYSCNFPNSSFCENLNNTYTNINSNLTNTNTNINSNITNSNKNLMCSDDFSIINKIDKIINNINTDNIVHHLPPIKDYYTYTLVLDLDATLIYLSQETEKKKLIFRPGLLEFLHDMKQIYELVLFSSGVNSYVDPIVDAIERNENFFDYVLYKKHITKDLKGNLVKDIGLLGRDLKNVIIIDDLPQYLKLYKKNSICIRPFLGDVVRDKNTLKILGRILKKIRYDADETNDITLSLKRCKDMLYPEVISELDE